MRHKLYLNIIRGILTSSPYNKCYVLNARICVWIDLFIGHTCPCLLLLQDWCRELYSWRFAASALLIQSVQENVFSVKKKKKRKNRWPRAVVQSVDAKLEAMEHMLAFRVVICRKKCPFWQWKESVVYVYECVWCFGICIKIEWLRAMVVLSWSSMLIRRGGADVPCIP